LASQVVKAQTADGLDIATGWVEAARNRAQMTLPEKGSPICACLAHHLVPFAEMFEPGGFDPNKE